MATDNSSITLATWETTRKCNMRCLHCYNESGPGGYELPFDNSVKLLDRLSDFGIRTLVMSGGEPLTRADILELSKYARRRFEELVLQTNGSLIPYVDEDVIKQYDEVNISIYGLSQIDAYIKQYLQPNIQKTIQRLRSLNIPFTFSTVLMRANKDEIEGLYKYTKENGAVSLLIQELVPIGRITQNPELILEQSERNNIRRKLEEYNDDFIKFGCLQECGGGTIFIEVDYKGNISPCAFVSSEENLFRKTLEEIVWYSRLFLGFRKFKNGKKLCPLFIGSDPKKSYKELEIYIS